ncbi:RNA-directed DNA polymerase, eukaryota [Tanacetum coccineum]
MSSYMVTYKKKYIWSNLRANASCILLVVYGDDIVITGSDKARIKKLKSFNGQTKAKPCNEPMIPKLKIKFKDGRLLQNPGKYRRVVGKLNYLTITHPDIAFPVSVNKDKFLDLPSFVSVTNGIEKPTVDTSSTNANIRALALMIKTSLMNKGFMELKIHHAGGLWIWIQFPLSSSADNFQTNASLKSVYSASKLLHLHLKVNYDIHVHVLGTWNINIVDETLDSSDNLDVNGMEKVEDSVDENSLADLNDLKETINELASNEIQHPRSKENMD